MANDITELIVEKDIVSKLASLPDGFFMELCRPSCGRHVFSAWSTCNITEIYEREFKLINGLCGENHRKFCYESISELFAFIEGVEACQAEEQCSQSCKNLIRDDSGYGCCILLPIDFRSVGGETGLRDVISATFSKCSEELLVYEQYDCLGILTNIINGLAEVNEELSPHQTECIANDLTNTMTQRLNAWLQLTHFSSKLTQKTC